jgi:EmrB/QacA subfamily drug resistance transporter
VLGSLMLSTGLVAIDATILATAVPSIVRDVGGFSQFPWLFSIYLLAQAVTVPIYGKLADMVGRRPVLFFGIGAFLIGSILCGFAWSMPSLIAFRAIQGIGAGSVLPMTMTVVGDMYTVEERAKVQGYIASVWGISSVVGPTLGGVFSDYLSWRWIFFVNIPLGAVAVLMLARHFKERVERRKHDLDIAGAVLLTAGCSLVILGLLEGGVAWAWGSTTGVLVFVVGALALAAFFVVERRAAEPVVPLWMLSRRILAAGSLVSLGVGAVLIGLSSYVPTYVQGVLGTSALVAGFALAAMTVGWPIAASVAGRIYMNVGFRSTALLGSAFVVAGTVLVTLLTASSHVWEVGATTFVVGVGLGFASVPTVVAMQSAVGWEHRGVATGMNMFARSIGSAVGIAVFGAIANATLSNRLDHPPASVHGLPQGHDVTSIVLGGGLHGSAATFVRTALFDAAHNVFLAQVVVAVLGVVAVLLMPRRTSADSTAAAPADRMSSGSSDGDVPHTTDPETEPATAGD